MFKEQLKVLLKERNMSQYRLSKITGIPESTIHTYISGKRHPAFYQVCKIASAFNVPTDYFFLGFDIYGELANFAKDVNQTIVITVPYYSTLYNTFANALRAKK